MQKITDNTYTISFKNTTRFNVVDGIIKRNFKRLWLNAYDAPCFLRSRITRRIGDNMVESFVYLGTQEEVDEMEKQEIQRESDKKIFSLLAWYGDWAWNVPEWYTYFTYTYDCRWADNKTEHGAIIKRELYDTNMTSLPPEAVPFSPDTSLPYSKN